MGVVMPLNAETAQARTHQVVNEDSTDIALFVRSSQDDMPAGTGSASSMPCCARPLSTGAPPRRSVGISR